ncbi:MAG TPA: inorganic diphosphatase, partial [Nitrolancea sp.]|nr:inorganic diphosphatase [Nitrolancea sp.]
MIIDAVIEDPKGATCRHYLDHQTGEWHAVPYPFTVEPWPANYGFLPGTHNPADDDELDVIVLAREPLATGTRLQVRPVAHLRLADGEHKVLSVATGDPIYGLITSLEMVPTTDLTAIEQWFPETGRFLGWEDAASAEALITCAGARDGDPAGSTVS